MPCGCDNNESLNKDKLNLNKDKLGLDTMKDLSIDEIISLYRQGYTLEDTEFVESGITYQYIPNIESMAYNCTGSPSTDLFRPIVQQGGMTIYRGNAGACKIVPTSRCLDTIMFYGVRSRTTPAHNIHIEIRQDSGGMPMGIPGDPTGRISDRVDSFPTSFSTYPITVVTELPAANIPYWIVIYSDDYYCGPQYVGAGYERVELSYANLAGNNRAYYDPLVPCVWHYPGSGDSWAIETFKLTYNPPVLTTISVTPTIASVNVGTTTQLTATCRDQNNNTISCPTLTWSSNNPAKASVNSSTGLVTGVAAGSANITASGGGVTSNASVITVTSPTPVLTTITVSPVSQSINVGSMVQLTAACKDQNNTTMTCPTLTWSSSNPAVASVNSSTGLVTGVAAGGPVNITANASGVTSNASAITVNAPSQILTVITISPVSQSINVGGVVQLTAACKDQNNTTMTCPTLTWSSNNPAKASVNSSTGLVTGVAAGSANITASASGVTSNISVITVTSPTPVLTTITVSPTSASIAPTYTKQFTVTCKDQNNTTMVCPTLTWLSSNTSTAIINSTGLSTGITVGSTNITASATGVTSNTATLTVSTTPPSAGGGGAMMIAAVAAIGIAYFMMKKTPK